jgi:hypothetical protein
VTHVCKTSIRASRRRSMIGRWLAVTAAAISLVVPAAALGWSPDMPGGIRGPANEGAATQTGLAERTATELSQRAEAPTAASAATQTGLAERTATELSQRAEAPTAASAGEASAHDGFSWTGAAIGAGAVAGLAALTGVAYAVRRRANVSPRPAV